MLFLIFQVKYFGVASPEMKKLFLCFHLLEPVTVCLSCNFFAFYNFTKAKAGMEQISRSYEANSSSSTSSFVSDLSEKIPFVVYKCSSYSYSYLPENIYHNKPSDQLSRWSSDSNNPPQFLVLKLEKPAIVKSVVFGKYEKTHVCNLKKLKIYGGLTEDHMIELLDGGLKNDHLPEKFLLRHEIDGHPFPCRFIKIVPLQAWGPSFNFSIWYVEIQGNSRWEEVKPCMNWYNTYREREAIRLCLKHFRQRSYTEAYEALSKKTNVSLEHPILTQLHNLLVVHGDFKGCEDLIDQANDEGIFEQYVSRQEYKPEWTPIEPIGCKKFVECEISLPAYNTLKRIGRRLSSGEISEVRPGMRGGHQMCVDVLTETIYMFGGWDGNRDLADFWSYHLPSGTWTCISQDTEVDGGPSARSCHKMAFDYERKQIFTLGRYLDQSVRKGDRLKCDFYMYDIESQHWTFITEDTAAMGGPRLIFDHQMVIDIKCQTIYVFGGRVLVNSSERESERPPEHIFSGLYSFHIPSNTWTLLLEDSPILRSRIGHSMLFHPVKRELYMFAGQRSKEYLNDFLAYHVDTKTIRQVTQQTTGKDSYQASFTQRATLDPHLNEIHVFSGLSRDKEKKENMKNSFWVYNIHKDHWSCIYRSESSSQQNPGFKVQLTEPMPRFAHQLVYDHVHKVHYLFGGNPGKESMLKTRLDDFWSLKLSRPSCENLLRQCRYLIRKHRFVEMSNTNPRRALSFLQTELAETVDHQDSEQTKEFQLLTSSLFPIDKTEEEEAAEQMEPLSSGFFKARTQLFDQLVDFFPESMTQPKENLVDLVPLY